MIHDDSTNIALAESIVIAENLDKTYPDSPCLMPVGAFSLHMAFVDALRPVYRNAAALYSMSKTIPCLNPSTAEMYRTYWETRFGHTVAELRPSAEVMDKTWKEYETGLESVSKWYKEPGATTFVGDQISFSDILLGS